MKPNSFTALLLLIVVLAAGVWDVIAGNKWGSTATISSVIYNWATRFPILPLAVGLVLGHLFWPVKHP
jgi:hypothetical protein